MERNIRSNFGREINEIGEIGSEIGCLFLIRRNFDGRVVIFLVKKNFETHAVEDINEDQFKVFSKALLNAGVKTSW